MAQFSVTKGTEFTLQWPQTQNIVSINSTQDVLDKLKLNELTSVTEKLDGCNCSISSSGWIASRRQILVDNIDQTDLSKTKFNGLRLIGFNEVWPKLCEAKAEIEENLNSKIGFELIIFGELMTTGTATTREDRFDYSLRGFKAEHFYAFGIAINFNTGLNEEERSEFEGRIKQQFDWALIQTCDSSKYFIFGYNAGLNKFFRERLFQTVPYVGDDHFKEILTNQSLVEKLKNRELEGFILTGPSFIIKWKFFEKGQKTSQKLAIEALKAELQDGDLVDPIKSLEDVVLSEAPEGKEFKPVRKLNRSLFGQFLGSAVSKLPSPVDSFGGSTGTLEQVLEACENYRVALEGEISKDLVEAGFKINSEDHKIMLLKIEGFIKGVKNKLIAAKLKKKI